MGRKSLSARHEVWHHISHFIHHFQIRNKPSKTSDWLTYFHVIISLAPSRKTSVLSKLEEVCSLNVCYWQPYLFLCVRGKRPDNDSEFWMTQKNLSSLRSCPKPTDPETELMELCLDQTITREDSGHRGDKGGGHVETASVCRLEMARWGGRSCSAKSCLQNWAVWVQSSSRARHIVFVLYQQEWGQAQDSWSWGHGVLPEDETQTHPAHVLIFTHSTSSVTSLID